LKELKKLTRRQASTVTQLLTEHVPLNKYLHCIRKKLSGICDGCRQHDKSVEHYLTRCPAHLAARARPRMKVGKDINSAARMLANTEYFEAIAKFVKRTRRLR
ncbi:hypothetical protein BDN71DRAFT_1354531, partial [Pleurotus eryngii]